jgi:hypothetical protein
MGIGYAWQKLHEGVHLLASSRQGLHERLVLACRHGIAFLQRSDFPENLQTQFDKIEKALGLLAEKKTEQEIEVDERKYPLSPDEASSLASEIVSLYDEVTKLYAIEQHGKEQSDSL